MTPISPPEDTNKTARLVSQTTIFIGVSLFIIIFIRQFVRIQSRRLERSLSCEGPRDESDRFRFDIFGIAKALELAYHFHNKSSLDYFNSLFGRYGETYASYIMGYRLLFTHNAENTKHLLSTAFLDFESSPLRKPLFEPITPHGIFTLDGLQWKASRDQLRGRLANLRKIIDLDVCEKHFQAFLKHVPNNGAMFDVQSCMFALSLDLQTLFSLGESIDALSFDQSAEKKQFFDDLLFVKTRIVRDGFRGPLRHLYPKGSFLQACERVRKFVLTRASREIRKTRKEVVLDQDLEDITQFTDQALSILLANDSMSTTLSGVFYCLAKDQRIVSKLRKSIVDAIGLSPPTWTDLGSLQYVRWVIFEAMRLYPPVVINARVANKVSTLPSGGGIHGTSPILIRKGEIVVFSTWARHRLGSDFGTAPHEFWPERWGDLAGDIPGFIPFNKGPRICPGQNYAMIVLTYILARMFQRFSVVSDYNDKPWTERIGMTLENDNGVLIGLE